VGLSRDPRRISWRAVGTGLALQVGLALVVLETQLGRDVFASLGAGVRKFLEFTDAGSRFVFGVLADPQVMSTVFGDQRGFVFAFRALPTIIFVAAFFAGLYHLGVLQWVVRGLARGMLWSMRVSGAESLNAAANIFMGQTEAPLMVKPYLESMTRSELLALMIAGMATMSAGIIAVYIDLGVGAEALLTASVMAAPASLVVAKLLLPEDGQPVTAGRVSIEVPREQANVFDALTRGASDGLKLALNVAAMLIAFLALIAMVDYLLGFLNTSLSGVFGWVFAPFAFLTGVPDAEVSLVGGLLGTKLVANEFVGYLDMTRAVADGALGPRAATIATFALCGFANLGSLGIQIGGIGGLVPARRQDMAQLAWLALAGGSLVTLFNAAVAGVLIA
jgi:CNT family concentrative nucleoside transporter